MRYLQAGLTLYDKERATPGYTLYTPSELPTSYLLNMAGEVVHTWDLPNGPGNYGYLLPNGNLLIAIRIDGGPPGFLNGGLLLELDWASNIVWEYTDPNQHHDFRRLSNGNTIYLGWEPLPPEAAAQVTGGIPGTDDNGILGDYIREVTPDGETAWEWHACDHMDLAKYPLGPNARRHEYAHPNTIFPMPDENILLCFRHIDVIAIIDRTTNKFCWERHEADWGGPHDVQLLDNGHMMIFANRGNKQPRGSKIIEFDQETGQTYWDYQGNPTHTFHSHFISGAQRLWSGNTLICEGLWGRIFEVTPEGEEVWEYISPHTFQRKAGPSVGDVNFVFRAYRYPENSPAVGGRLNGQLGI